MAGKSANLIVWSRSGTKLRLAARCGMCNGMGRFYGANIESEDCEHCYGRGWFGIDPKVPVEALPGTVEKVAVLTVRYATGTPLFDRRDGFDPEAARRKEILRGPAKSQTEWAAGPLSEDDDSLEDILHAALS
jgi:hypothetical protein